jgi:hypothetical protein
MVIKRRADKRLGDAVNGLTSSGEPAVRVLTQVGAATDAELNHWLGTRRGRRLVRRLTRRLAALRELDVARAGAAGAERLFMSITGDDPNAKPADRRAIAIAAVQLARAGERLRRSSAVKPAATDTAAPALEVDPALLAVLEAARRETSAGESGA